MWHFIRKQVNRSMLFVQCIVCVFSKRPCSGNVLAVCINSSPHVWRHPQILCVFIFYVVCNLFYYYFYMDFYLHYESAATPEWVLKFISHHICLNWMILYCKMYSISAVFSSISWIWETHLLHCIWVCFGLLWDWVEALSKILLSLISSLLAAFRIDDYRHCLSPGKAGNCFGPQASRGPPRADKPIYYS